MNKASLLPIVEGRAGARGLVSALLLLGLTGCSFLRPVQSNARFYVLTADPPGPAAEAAPAKDRFEGVVRVGPVQLAGYLRTKAMVVRTGSNELAFTLQHKWGESLDEGIRRVLAEDLRRSRAGQAVLTDEAPPPGQEVYELELHVLACEGTLGSPQPSASFRALWRLSGPGGRVRRGEFELKPAAWNGRDYGELAQALSRGLHDLAQALIKELPRQAADRSPG